MDAAELRLVADVRRLAQERFAARATAHDREGSFPHDNLIDLRELRIPSLGVPARLDGLDISPAAQLAIMEAIAYGDASTAVALNMHRIGVEILAHLPPSSQWDTVLADVGGNGALLCLPASIPTGGLDNRRSGYRAAWSGRCLRIDGVAGFASMSEGASYAVLTAVLSDEKAASSATDLVIVAPRLDTPGLEVRRTWDSMGLRATGSHDIVCDGLLVPRDEAFVIPLSLARAVVDAVEAQGGLAYQRRSLATLGVLAIWLGLAQAAFDFTVAYVAKRHGHLAGSADIHRPALGYRAEQPWAQAGIGAMAHWLETGRIVLDDMVRRLETAAPSGRAFQHHLLCAIYHLRRMTEEVALEAMKVCGAHAYVRSRPLERIVRDMLGGVVMAWKTGDLVQTLGRSALGLELSPPVSPV